MKFSTEVTNLKVDSIESIPREGKVLHAEDFRGIISDELIEMLSQPSPVLPKDTGSVIKVITIPSDYGL